MIFKNIFRRDPLKQCIKEFEKIKGLERELNQISISDDFQRDVIQNQKLILKNNFDNIARLYDASKNNDITKKDGLIRFQGTEKRVIKFSSSDYEDLKKSNPGIYISVVDSNTFRNTISPFEEHLNFYNAIQNTNPKVRSSLTKSVYKKIEQTVSIYSQYFDGLNRDIVYNYLMEPFDVMDRNSFKKAWTRYNVSKGILMRDPHQEGYDMSYRKIIYFSISSPDYHIDFLNKFHSKEYDFVVN